jgi:hypothetical protein
MATPVGTLVARLTRIRAENRIGKTATGLGAINVDLLRRTGLGTQPLAVQLPGNRVEGLRARPEVQTALQNRVTRVEGTSNKALTEALLAKRQSSLALQRANAGAAASAPGGAGSALARLRERTNGRAPFLIARGLRVARSPVQGLRSMAMRGAGPLMIAHLGVGAATMATEGMSNAIETIQKADSAGEAARAIGGSVAEGLFKIAAGDALSRLIRSFGRLSNTVNPNSFNTQEFDRRREEMFMSREAVGRRREERARQMAEITADSERKIAEARQFINDYAPRTFTVATRHDRQVYRRDLWRVNARAYDAHVAALRDGAATSIRELD